MGKIRNNTVDDLTDMLIEKILQETYLSKEVLNPLVKSFVKAFVDLKNVPTDYNKIESPTLQARRLRTIEQRDIQIKYWIDAVKSLDGDNIKKYYDEQNDLLKKRGFLNQQ